MSEFNASLHQVPWPQKTQQRRRNPTEQPKENVNDSKMDQSTTAYHWHLTLTISLILVGHDQSLNAGQCVETCEDQHEAHAEQQDVE